MSTSNLPERETREEKGGPAEEAKEKGREEEEEVGKKRKAAPSRKDLEGASLIEESLFRLTRGIPNRELRLMVAESMQCEEELIKEIELLEKALTDEQTDVDVILQSPLSPLDNYWTASALLGRLRNNLAVPSSAIDEEDTIGMEQDSTVTSPNANRLLALMENPFYNTHHDATATLLGIWKKIASSKSALVFKRPVKPEEAPGYTDRIFFPMDLSLIRKMIVARQHILSIADLHRYIGLICHDCVKYNGRETDYGRVAREFEAAADDIIREAVERASGMYTASPLHPAKPPFMTNTEKADD